MKFINEFWWFVAAAFAIACIPMYSFGWLFWNQLAPSEKAIIEGLSGKNLVYILSAITFVIACLIFTLDGILHVYIFPAKKT